jgi:hypothetical protein
MSFCRVCIATVSLWTVTACLATSSTVVQAQDLLQWKFNQGETLKYAVQQSMDITTEVAGTSTASEVRQKMDMSWQILDVAATSNATMNQVIDRMQMQMKSGNNPPIVIDTQSTTPSDNPIVRAMTDTFDKMVGKQFKVTMRPSGQVVDVAIPQELLDTIQKSSAVNPNAINEAALKEMMQQTSVTLPATPIKPGQTWTTTQRMNLPTGTVEMSPTMTYRGQDAETGLALIDVAPKISIQPREGATSKVTLKEAQGIGLVKFDLEKGRVRTMQLKMTLKMDVETQGQVFAQTIEQNTAMILQP